MICGLEVKIHKLVKNRVRTQGHDIFEQECGNISCAPLSVSVFAHIFILDYVREVIVLMSNALAAQSDSPTPPSTYYRHN